MNSSKPCKKDPEYFRRSKTSLGSDSRKPRREDPEYFQRSEPSLGPDSRKPRKGDPEYFWRSGPGLGPHSSRPRRGDPEYFWRRRAALRLLPWTRASFKTVFSDFGGGGGQFLFEVTSTRAADFGGRRRPVRP